MLVSKILLKSISEEFLIISSKFQIKDCKNMDSSGFMLTLGWKYN